jgi:hypothetical protein
MRRITRRHDDFTEGENLNTWNWKWLASVRSLGSVLMLVACAQLDVHSGYQLAPASQKGILALGITASDDMPNFYWHIRKPGSTDVKDLTFYTLQNPLTWDHPRGRLVTIELEAGDYEIFDWGSPFKFAATQYFRIPFSVKPGQVTYLGRLHLELNQTDMHFTVDATDRFPEDFPRIREKIPGIEAAAVYRQQAVFQACGEASCAKPNPAAQMHSKIVIPIVIRSR